MPLAVFEAYYSRPLAPTRRLALGSMQLPSDPAPGYGGILLGGIAANYVPELESDLIEPVYRLIDDVEMGLRIAQPRVRHRLQDDRVGLQRCRHLLLEEKGEIRFSFQTSAGTPSHNLLCAIYAISLVPIESRAAVATAVRKGLAWHGELNSALVAHLGDRSVSITGTAMDDPLGWAGGILAIGLEAGVPEKSTVQQAYRDALREAHPDHGAPGDLAADRIAELVEARRILLGAA